MHTPKRPTCHSYAAAALLAGASLFSTPNAGAADAVIEWNVIAEQKNSTGDVRTLSGLLGVGYLLQGSVRVDGQAVRIAAQLVDRSGLQVWSETFDRELSGVFAIQGEVADAVATSIVPRVSPVPVDQRLPDIQAYQHYLIGREILQKRVARYDELALEQLDRAIELDPGFAEAYAERAIVLLEGLFLTTDYVGYLEHARKDVDTALAMQPDLARVHVAKALLRAPLPRRSEEASLRRALALDPNMVDARYLLSMELHAQGRTGEAAEELERAARLDPLAPDIVVRLAKGDFDRGDFLASERRLKRLLTVPQPAEIAFRWLWRLYFETGRLVEAADVARQSLLSAVAAGGRPARHYLLVSTYGRLGLGPEAEYWQHQYEREYPDNYMVALLPVWTWESGMGHLMAQGRYDEALALSLETLDAHGLAVDGVQPYVAWNYGMLQAFNGAHADAVQTLEAALDPTAPVDVLELFGEVDVHHVLAWSHGQTGASRRAAEILDALEAGFLAVQAEGRLHRSSFIYLFAQNALLSGDRAGAITRLRQAVEAGWRDYYRVYHDPRWQPLRDDPEFLGLIAEVKADVDAQRAVVDREDNERDFAAQVEAAVAVEASRRGGGGRRD